MRFGWFTGALVVGVLALPSGARAQTLLLVPNSGADTIVALNPLNGAVVNANFIFDAALQTPNMAIDSGRNTVLVSDQLLDEVREYSASGAFLRTLAGPAQGLDNVRGIAVRNGVLYVTVASGSNTGTIQRFDVATGASLGTFANLNTVNAGASPWDILFRSGDVLISDSTGDDLLRYDFAGNFLGRFVDGSNSGPINFPEQIAPLSNGNLMVGSFSLPTALYEFNGSSGALLNSYAVNTGVRGTYELGNGQILYSAGTQLRLLDRASGNSTVIQDAPGNSFRLFSTFTVGGAAAAPEPASVALLALGLGGAATLARRRRQR